MDLRRLLPLLLLAAAACGRQERGPGPAPRAGHAGGAACAGCHQAQAAAFAKSDHAKAMDLPTAQTVLGDFGGAVFEHLGVVSRFARDGDKYLVTTENAAGAAETFEVAYVFGHFPLQQYLVRFPGGRLQCLPLAWDSRPKEQGGSRWFHLYGDEKIGPGDPLHWTGPMQNWNHMCAGCHSTALEKGFDAASETFHTTWAERSISCESCHGPGQAHVQWAAKPAAERSADPLCGFTHPVVDRARRWEMDPETGIARRTGAPAPAAQVDACMRCHARAEVLDERVSPTAPLADARRPELLGAATYHGTGEIKDEVYEWGSFVQSRMHAAGVTCADCHDPHSGATRLAGNFLCAQCHLPAKFDTPAHHHHAAGSAGAQCVACHMPEHTYMQVDGRRDHGFRVPRPDLTLRFGPAEAPNACNACHAKPAEDAGWAAAKIKEWNGGREPRPTFAEALLAGRAGRPEAPRLLAALATDPAMPAVARATALMDAANLARSPAELARLRAAARKGLADPDPFVRAQAAALPLEPADALAWLPPLLKDEAKVVRLAAARALLPLEAQLPEGARAAQAAAAAELVAAAEINADRAEGCMNLGTIAMLRGDAAGAERWFGKALARSPGFAPAWVNRAELARLRGDDAAGEALLREGLRTTYDPAPLHHALGLLLVRRRDYAGAEAAFKAALAARPEQPRHALLLALAQDALGRRADAIATVRLARRSHPFDRDLLATLADLAAKSGFMDEAAAAQALLAQWE